MTDQMPPARLHSRPEPFSGTLLFANGDVEHIHLIRSQSAETAAADLVLAYWRNLPAMAESSDDWDRYEAARGVPVEIIVRPFNSDGILYRADTRWCAA